MRKLESVLVTNVEAKLIIQAADRRNKEGDKDAELGHEQKIALDYLRNFAKANKSDIEEAKKKLDELGFLKEHQVIMLLNMLPQNKEDLDVIFSKERATLNEEQLGKIISITKKV